MERLIERQTELTRIIESIDGILKDRNWQLFEDLVLKNLVERLEGQLLSEAKASEPNLQTIYRLQGQLLWANRYADLKSYASMLMKELEGLKKQIKNE